MPLRAHLVELRHRLFLSVLGIMVGAVIGWFLYTPVFQALQRPILDVAKSRQALITLNFPGLAASFDMQIKVSFFLGVLISSPWWIYQLWAFITPGLTRKERGYAFGFVGVAVPLFLIGAYLAWWALPNAVRLLTGFTPKGAANFIDAQVYLGFVMRLMLAFGLAFELPIAILLLSALGIIKPQFLSKYRRHAIVITVTVAAFITPDASPTTLFALSVPLYLLYELGVALSYFVTRKRRQRAEAAEREERMMAQRAEAEEAVRRSPRRLGGANA